jgi:sigma-B regulation protein RsbU (phosphoserine phosphatase)
MSRYSGMDLTTTVSALTFARYFGVGAQSGYLDREPSHRSDGFDWLPPEPLAVPEPAPATLPSHPRLQFGRFHGRGRVAGGDYHDVISLGGNRFAIVMADISGPRAGATAAMIRASVGGHARRHADSGSLLHHLSEHFRYPGHEGLSATGLCAVIDIRRRTMQLACAGHPAPLLAREGTAVMPLLLHNVNPLGRTGLIVISEYDLRSGDRLLFYTDGITDRTNTAGTRYSVNRLTSSLAETRDAAAALAVGRLANDVERFADGHEPDDDQTLVMVGIV